ncbi:hypothetical protein Srufu_079610 (plasmid) [Streptomyces libani subsp. rufus]|nr:hypothetical protein Srufu_079610 [Streptomyces libani subsp. rufus]
MPDQPSAHSVRIDAQPGSASIRIDGAEVGDQVLGYTIQHDIHSTLPQLVLHTRQPAGTLFNALAHVLVADPAPPGEAIVEFLRTINPIELEQAALERDDLGDERYDLTRAMLAQLTDWARERSA